MKSIPSEIVRTSPDTYQTLTKKYGSPLFILSLVELKKQLESLNKAWINWLGPLPRFYFPLKTNDFVPFLHLVKEYGLGFDISESSEIDVVLNLIGAVPSKVVLNGPAKERHAIYKAIRKGIRIHVDSLDELLDVNAIATDLNCSAKIGIRLRFGDVSKFGLSPSDPELQECLKIVAQSRCLSLVAIHQHDPVSLNSTSQLKMRVEAIGTFLQHLQDLIGTTQLEVDLGGGLNLGSCNSEFRSFTNFVESFGVVTRRTHTEHWRFAFEWGRAIVGPCGLVISTIVRKKDSQGTQWLYLDVGQNVIGGNHANVTHSIVSPNGEPPTSLDDTVQVNLAGPLCFSSDVIAEDVSLPRVSPGDIVVIGEAGAYTFNTRWRGPGKEPVILLESDSGILHVGRMSNELPTTESPPHLLSDLFHLFFEEEFGSVASPPDHEIAFGVSSGTNQLDTPASLRSLLSNEIATGESLRVYTGPYGSDEIVVSALAFEEAIASSSGFDKIRCVVTLGAAQACARTFSYLSSLGYDHCVIAGPQYPLIYDLLRQARIESTELIGTIEDGYLPSAESIVRTLKMRPRSVLFLTVPNNPTGTCPSDDWLTTVLAIISDSNSHVVIDRSSEDLPFAPWMRFPLTTKAAIGILPPTAFTIINTISKSRSVPGLRLGYLFASEALARSVAYFNYTAYLSIPRAGTRVVSGDLLLRALWWRQSQLGESLDHAVTVIKSTVCRSDTPSINEDEFEAIISLYRQYCDECTSNAFTISEAQRAFIEGLQQYWITCTPHHNGFNVIAEIATSESGSLFAKSLFRATGIRLFPSECFRMEGRALKGARDGLTFRLSSAEKPLRLRSAGETLRMYMQGIPS
jgi:diaminopimelate decarboxylase